MKAIARAVTTVLCFAAALALLFFMFHGLPAARQSAVSRYLGPSDGFVTYSWVSNRIRSTIRFTAPKPGMGLYTYSTNGMRYFIRMSLPQALQPDAHIPEPELVKCLPDSGEAPEWQP
jgi:hypothetical protein